MTARLRRAGCELPPRLHGRNCLQQLAGNLGGQAPTSTAARAGGSSVEAPKQLELLGNICVGRPVVPIQNRPDRSSGVQREQQQLVRSEGDTTLAPMTEDEERGKYGVERVVVVLCLAAGARGLIAWKSHNRKMHDCRGEQ